MQHHVERHVHRQVGGIEGGEGVEERGDALGVRAGRGGEVLRHLLAFLPAVRRRAHALAEVDEPARAVSARDEPSAARVGDVVRLAREVAGDVVAERVRLGVVIAPLALGAEHAQAELLVSFPVRGHRLAELGKGEKAVLVDDVLHGEEGVHGGACPDEEEVRVVAVRRAVVEGVASGLHAVGDGEGEEHGGVDLVHPFLRLERELARLAGGVFK